MEKDLPAIGFLDRWFLLSKGVVRCRMPCWGLVEKTGADAQLNRANAAAARRAEQSDLRSPPHLPILAWIMLIGPFSSPAGVFVTGRIGHALAFNMLN